MVEIGRVLIYFYGTRYTIAYLKHTSVVAGVYTPIYCLAFTIIAVKDDKRPRRTVFTAGYVLIPHVPFFYGYIAYSPALIFKNVYAIPIPLTPEGYV